MINFLIWLGGILGFVMMITYQPKEVSTRFMDSIAAQKTTIIILDVVTQVFFYPLNLK